MHLDLETDDIEAEVRRLEALGATRYDHQQERGFDFWVMRDPWGDEFCVLHTDQPEVRHTEGGIARAMFRVAVSGRWDQEASFFTVVVWRDQAEHAAESLSKGSRVVVVGRLQQRSWTAEDGSARSVVEVVAEELGASLRWATATTT
jgi:hypothetical protein